MAIKTNLEYLVEEVRKKRELSGIADSLIEEHVKAYISKRNINLENISKLTEKDKKLIIKEIRAGLRLAHGRFQIGNKNREKLLSLGKIQNLLETHSSTKERMAVYLWLKEMISDLKVKSILDLGCGLNPIALASPGVEYNASDINDSELSIIKSFFSNNGISGKVFFYDLTKFKKEDMPSADLVIIFKVFDLLKKKGYGLIEEILLGLKCEYILVSFSTRKLSGKMMNNPKRRWFESTLRKINLEFKLNETKNEIFYLIRK